MRRLLIRPGAIGDCILSLPTLEAARAEYTEVWAPRAALPLIRFADRTRAIIDTGLDLVGVTEDARVPALEAFDSIYSWYGTQRQEFRNAVAHLPFTFFPALPPLPPRQTVLSPSQPFFSPAQPFFLKDAADANGIPCIPVPDAPIENFAVIHPFASSPRKRWPLDQFRALERELLTRFDLPVRWCAGPEEPLDNAVRIENLYDLGCWLATARVYIGNDSGIAHLAAAVGTPVVAIFLVTDPQIWAPRGPHVAVLRNPDLSDVRDAAGRIRRR